MQRISAGRASTSLAVRTSRRALNWAKLHAKCTRIQGGPLLEHGVPKVPAHKLSVVRLVDQRQPSVAARPGSGQSSSSSHEASGGTREIGDSAKHATRMQGRSATGRSYAWSQAGAG